ncbi:EXG3 [Malassezia furfur]|nr:EXG3 [Malassezia furfur]
MRKIGGTDIKNVPPVDTIPTDKPIDSRRIFQYRKQRGVNLGSWFSLESWLTGSLFEKAAEPRGSEYDVASNMSPEDARKMLENHWSNFINDGDWKWMAQHGVNSVRLPIGYFHFLSGADQGRFSSLLKNTEFEKFAPVYQGAWQYILQGIEKARAHNIGVLVDLHGAPGGQNKDGHCGISNSKCSLWHGLHTGKNQRLTIEILVDLAEALAGFDNVIGLELLNEPENNSGLEAFYTKAIAAIRESSVPQARQLPIYLGDAWVTKFYADYVGENTTAGSPLALDHHVYRCFTPQDHNTSAEEHAQNIDPNGDGKTARWLQDVSNKAHGSLIIGEWSGALNPRSFELSKIQSKLQARTLWSKAQWMAFERFTAGYYYWTLKKEGGPDPGWCLYTAMEKGSMPPSLDPLQGRRPDLQKIQGILQQELKNSYEGHCHYWDSQVGGSKFEHWRYERGFELAAKDALQFIQAGSEIGFSHNLGLLRLAAHEKETGGSKYLWEFQHGYKAGAAAASRVLYA